MLNHATKALSTSADDFAPSKRTKASAISKRQLHANSLRQAQKLYTAAPMGARLSKIYTRTGDAGDTGLADGNRISKADTRIRLLGELDELNAVLGWTLAADLPADVRNALAPSQHHLFDLGGDISLPGRISLTEKHVQTLEGALDALNSDLPPLKEFILPGGNEANSRLHLARTVCRRTERTLVQYGQDHPLPGAALSYVNRLSDLLFVCARQAAKTASVPEIYWQPTA